MRFSMQGVVRFVAMGLALLPLTGRSEEAPERPRTLVLAQPLYGYLGQVAASVEHAVGSHVALAGAVQGVLYVDDNAYGGVSTGFSTQRWGVGVDPGVHFFLAGRAPEGLWVGPHAELSVLHHRSEHDLVVYGGSGERVRVSQGSRTLQYGASARVGYNAILSPGLSVQVSAGLWALQGQYTSFTTERPDGIPVGEAAGPTRSWSVGPRMTLGVGWGL